jgi:hypothetical protein
MERLLGLCLLLVGVVDEADLAFFEVKVRPVLIERCHKCHGPNVGEGKAKLRVDTCEALLRGGNSCLAIAPGDSEGSLLILAIRHEGAVALPLKSWLPQAGIDALAAWIKTGAPWPETSPGAAASDAKDGPNPPETAAPDFWAPVVGPYKVRDPDHFLFKRTHDLQLRAGDALGGAPGRLLPQPIGHEGDVRVSTLARFLVEPLPTGASAPPSVDPAGITLLAEEFADSRKPTFAWDYFQRPVPPAKYPLVDAAAEMIYWERHCGGRVFHAGSINAGSTLALDSKWSGLMHNLLAHFGVPHGKDRANS